MKLKRLLLVVLSLTALLCMALSFAACGEKEHRHTLVNGYSKDATGHWLTCIDCDELVDKAEHTGDPCEICGYTSNPAGTNPPETHTHVLTRIGLKEPTCAEPGNEEYYTCEGCGKYFSDSNGKKEIKANTWVLEATGKHTPNGVYQKDDTYHWQKCSVCETDMDKTIHTSSESKAHDNEYHWNVCVCGEAVGQKEAHTESNEWGQDATNHWKKCDCGQPLSTPEAHKEATADDDELTPDQSGHKFKCQVCGIVSVPHEKTNYDPYEDPSNDFLYKSLHHYTCSVCNYRGLEDHRYADGASFNIDDNNHKFECIDCHVYAEKSHFYTRVFDSDTNHKAICTVCGYSFTEKHTFGQNDYKTDGTYHWQFCSVCNYERTDTKAEHTDSAGWHVSEAGHYKFCKTCQKSYYPLEDHDKGLRRSNGLYHWYDCKICNGEVEKSYHTYVLEKNWDSKTCDDCQYTLTESVGLDIRDNVLYGIKDCTDTVIVIPSTVTEIAKSAFATNKNITGLIIPDSVTVIGQSAFAQCSNLDTLIMGKGVIEIQETGLSNTNIKNFYYTGTIAEFKKIKKGMNWFGSVIDFHCSDGDINYRELDA